jgi:tetratricopeptide (TPR) repeat protein
VSEVQSGKRQANADLKIENGRVQVTGALGVMEINGILTKMMFDHERLRHAFYVEESYVIQWMYPYLSPHGLIMKINKDPNPLTPQIIQNDMEFWDWYMRRLLKDKAFRRDFPAQKSFSKLRAAIAGLYSHTGRYREAEQAFREAVLLYPASPEASFRYIQEVLLPTRKWDVINDILDFTDRVDPNNSRTGSMRGYAQRMRQLTDQIGALQAKAAKAPLSAHENLMLAQCYLQLGQTGAARGFTKKGKPLGKTVTKTFTKAEK